LVALPKSALSAAKVSTLSRRAGELVSSVEENASVSYGFDDELSGRTSPDEGEAGSAAGQGPADSVSE
jgi:hypothetical protein